MNEVPVTVSILDRVYKMKVRPEDQGYLKAAEESINAQIAAYKKNYSYRDYQDLLAMVAIAKTTQLAKLQKESISDHDAIREKLENIENILMSQTDGETK